MYVEWLTDDQGDWGVATTDARFYQQQRPAFPQVLQSQSDCYRANTDHEVSEINLNSWTFSVKTNHV